MMMMVKTMNKKLICSLALIMILATSAFLTGCNSDANTLKDGYYTAEDTVGSFGWFEFITIYVDDGRIVSVEYNAKNASGFIKSWDMDYMRVMNSTDGTYPNEYTRTYANELLESQKVEDVDAIAGATESHTSFVQLANAALEKARAGDFSVALVDVKHKN